MLKVIGRRRIEAFELGNEPELYGSRPWYSTATGREVSGRSRDWWLPTLNQDYTRIVAAMGSVPLAGPTMGTLSWMPYLSQFLAGQGRVKVVTLHRYPLQSCSVGRQAPNYPTIGHLLSQKASLGLADSLSAYVAIAHARGLPVRSDEMNSVSCGYSRGVSNTFASALWSLDALFQMASVGVDGVNMHTYPGAGDQLFAFRLAKKSWRGVVAPEYYGLMMFAQAAPRGSRLLQVAGASPTLRVWATKAPSGRIRVLLINDDIARSQCALLRVPGAGATAALERLQAPSVRATHQVTLAGQRFAHNTSTGLLTGSSNNTVLHRAAGVYTVRLAAASAALLTMP
jgi:hypothetical protein